MVNRLFKKYFSIILMIATFMGVFHHHNDLKQHNNCPLCTLQASIANADTPVDVVYITALDLAHESILKSLQNLHVRKITNQLQVRAPPKIS